MIDLFTAYSNLPVNQWDYYYDINDQIQIPFPFTGFPSAHNDFIREYFRRGGKAEAMESVDLSFDNLRLPNHINSVFFLGILMYNNTSMHRKYKLENNAPGYKSFPFIWFLIALFHDNAYELEDKKKLVDISSIELLRKHFQIDELLHDKVISSRYHALLDSRENYFLYRKNVFGVVDHGILGGILLYDRLVKIRAQKKKENKDNKFWGIKLVNQYLKAANAISLHNVWMPTADTEKIYEENNLGMLIGIPKVKFFDFPLFYILAIIDTIEPIKIYKGLHQPDIKILSEINIVFQKNSIILSKNIGSDLDFSVLVRKAEGLLNWIDIGIRTEPDLVEIIFHY